MFLTVAKYVRWNAACVRRNAARFDEYKRFSNVGAVTGFPFPQAGNGGFSLRRRSLLLAHASNISTTNPAGVEASNTGWLPSAAACDGQSASGAGQSGGGVLSEACLKPLHSPDAPSGYGPGDLWWSTRLKSEAPETLATREEQAR